MFATLFQSGSRRAVSAVIVESVLVRQYVLSLDDLSVPEPIEVAVLRLQRLALFIPGELRDDEEVLPLRHEEKRPGSQS